jgi:hypothetical protein
MSKLTITKVVSKRKIYIFTTFLSSSEAISATFLNPFQLLYHALGGFEASFVLW